MNVGEARGSLIIDGLTKTIKDLNSAKVELTTLNAAQRRSRKIVQEHVEALRQISPTVKRAIGSNTGYLSTIKAINAAITEQSAKVQKQIQLEQRLAATRAANKASMAGAYNAANVAPTIPGGLNVSPLTNFNPVNDAITKMRTNLTGLNAKLRETATIKFNKLKDSIRATATSTDNLTKKIQKNHQHALGWAQRFGVVAIGFWAAYRAINALEYAIVGVTSTFWSGLRIMDEYREGLATTAGMIAMISTGMGGFSDRFKYASDVMAGTMEESIRLGPLYRLSVEEISAGFRELAQFGVVVTRDMAENSLNVLALIKEIAATTGGTSKQIRQELQALFNGTARQTDQFMKMIQNSLPELYQKLQDGTVSNAEKWRLLTDRAEEFKGALLAITDTVGAQQEVLVNTLGLISGKALETSGIYQSWVDQIRTFRENLLNTDGTLGAMGQTMYRIFYRTWQVVDNLIQTLVAVGQAAYSVVQYFQGLRQPIKDAVGWYGKFLLYGLGIKAGLAVIVGLAALIISPARIFATAIGSVATHIVGIPLILNKIKNTMFVISGTAGTISLSIFGWAAAIVGGIIALDRFEAAMRKVAGNDTLAGQIEEQIRSVENAIDQTNKRIDAKLTQVRSNPNNERMLASLREEYDYIDTLNARLLELQQNLANTDPAEKTQGLIDGMLASSTEALKQLVNSPLITEITNKFKGIWDFGEIKDMSPKQFQEWVEGVLEFADKGAEALEKVKDKWADMRDTLLQDIAKSGMDQFEQKIFDVAVKAGDLHEKFGQIADASRLINEWTENQITAIQNEASLYQAELDIKNRMHQIDLAASVLDITREEAVTRRKVANEQLLAVYEDMLATLSLGPVEYQALIEKIQEARAAQVGFNQEFQKAFGDAGAGVSQGMRQWLADSTTTFEAWGDTARATVDQVSSSFSSFFRDSTRGEMKDFREYMADWATNIADIFSDMISKMIVRWLVFQAITGTTKDGSNSTSTLASAFMNTGRYSVGGGGTDLAFYNGGVISEPVFGYGLNSGKSYSFAEKGPERVLSNADSFGQPSVNVSLNMTNESGQALDMKQGPTQVTPDQIIINAVLKDINNYGKLGRTLRRS